MNEIIRKDAISILSKVITILKVKEEKDVTEIKALSNHTIHNASVFQDETSVSIAILIYSLSKIIERDEKQLDYGRIVSMLQDSKNYLERNLVGEFNRLVRKIFKIISNVDSKIKLYIEEVINQAEIKKSCKLCEHGISVGRSAEILGISQWELLNYLGKTKLVEDTPDVIDLRTRIRIARSLFK
jgi:predicted transcriptional regulator|tara:strand:- start:668 stop:1222 length:555 start_codon:yes stop_codon:yes gene_type:complete